MAELAQLTRSMRGAASRFRRHQPKQRYMAFLSYSHKDAAIADWLHETLEEFRVPPRLVGKLTDEGVVPKRLTPIFRDRHELAASPDLGEEIEEAIAASRFLIVLCSPAAARSRWIDEEIACFKRLHREERILAAIIDGEPFASDDPDRAAEECFPPSLRVDFDARGRPTTRRSEPLAADLREEADGRKMGLLKIIAGMLGVGLDELAQREAQRRHKRMYIITAASVAGMLFTSGLAYTAIQARDEARDQRREAEGLIGFMLGDLRDKLDPLGRLDVLDSVGARALAYYEGQDKSDLSDDALAQRSRALTLMGEMAFTRGDLEGALRRYREAMEGTEEAVRRAPDNPQSLFDHAQNVFWVGYVDYQRGDRAKAEQAFREYRRLADRMIELAPNEDRYRLEGIYADTNLGTVLMDQRKYRAAAEAFQLSLEPIETLAAKAPGNRDYQTQLVDTLAWLADAREYSGQLDEALAHRRRQLGLLAQQWERDKGNTTIKRIEMTARRAIARLLAARGDLKGALAQSRQASNVIEWLTRTEPDNTEWLQAGANANFERAAIELAADRIDEARSVTATACATTSRLISRDRSVAEWRTRLQLRCLVTSARIALHDRASDEAMNLARQALALSRTEVNRVDRGLGVANAEQILGDALALAGNAATARGAYERALAAWPKDIEERPREMADRALLLRHLGRQAEADALSRQLAAMGYRRLV
jgi:tetratricopeptide (TPR) repeat protein